MSTREPGGLGSTCLLFWLWWFHYVFVSLTKLYTMNRCSVLYANCTSIKLKFFVDLMTKNWTYFAVNMYFHLLVKWSVFIISTICTSFSVNCSVCLFLCCFWSVCVTYSCTSDDRTHCVCLTCSKHFPLIGFTFDFEVHFSPVLFPSLSSLFFLTHSLICYFFFSFWFLGFLSHLRILWTPLTLPNFFVFL